MGSADEMMLADQTEYFERTARWCDFMEKKGRAGKEALERVFTQRVALGLGGCFDEEGDDFN